MTQVKCACGRGTAYNDSAAHRGIPMSQAPSIPERCDVLVVGAGPAGSAAAQWLARSGAQVLLIDQHVFPRDKVCGDGLIPDAHDALRRLGVLDEVMACAQPATHVACTGPRGGRIDVPGRLAVLPRRRLDDILCRAAQRAGARLVAPARFVAPIEHAGKVVGARLQQAGQTHEVRAAFTVLATGAVPQALLASGMATRQTPSGVALRGYLRNPAPTLPADKLEVVWNARLSGGYGWVFPCGDGVFNVGAGIFDSHSVSADGHGVRRGARLNDIFAAFVAVHPPLRALVEGGQWLAPPKGAPLRCTLEGARPSRPGLLVTGEAAGSTYAFTGEGIGKAMETGMLAAQAIVAGRQAGTSDTAVRADYEARLAALEPRFALYARANRVNHFPWIADVVIWRAQRSARLLQRMSGVLEETSNPGHLVTVKGVLRLFTE
jgi:geranylgeranyl reductase family protein